MLPHLLDNKNRRLRNSGIRAAKSKVLEAVYNYFRNFVVSIAQANKKVKIFCMPAAGEIHIISAIENAVRSVDRNIMFSYPKWEIEAWNTGH
jgi:hypothetical protein